MITKAFIYRVQDYKETSKLLFTFTPYGKYTFVARGVKNYKNPYFHLSDYFNIIEVEFNPDKSIQTLKNAKLINGFEEMKKDYKSFRYASFIGILINDLVFEIEINDRLFVLLETLLNYKDLKVSYLTFLVKLTYILGINLSFENEYEGFSIAEGRSVNIKKDLNKLETTYLKLLYYSKEEVKIETNIIQKLFNFIEKYYIYHLDYKIKKYEGD